MDLSKHLQKADEALRRRNHALAIGMYQQILDLDPDYADARRGLRKAIDKKFEGKKGGGILGVIQGFLPLLSAGIAKLTKGHQSRARNLERYLALVPNSISTALALGQALHSGGWNHSAYVVYRHLAERLSTAGRTSARVDSACLAWRSAGAMATLTNELADAMSCYEEALKLDPRDQAALRARKNLAAEGALKKGGFATATSSRELIKDQQAQAAMEKGQRMHRSAEEVQVDLSRVEGRLAEAPEDPKLLREVGNLRAQSGDVGGALDCLERVLTLDPDDFGLLVEVGDLRSREVGQQIEKAKLLEDEAEVARLEKQLLKVGTEEASKRVEAHPTDLGLRHALGLIHLKNGDVDRAIAELQKSVKDPRHKIDALAHLGKAFRHKGLADLAQSQLEKALEAAGNNHSQTLELLYELGCLAEDHKKPVDARAFFGRILEVDISFRDAAKRMEALGA